MPTPAGRKALSAGEGQQLTKIAIALRGSTQSLGGYTREICSCDEGTEESLPNQQQPAYTAPPLSDQKEQTKSVNYAK